MDITKQGENLIFLISQPRSGSTLLQLMLAGNDEVATTSEPWIALHPLFALRENEIETNYNTKQAKIALQEFLKESGVGIDFYKKQITSFLENLYNQSITYQKKNIFSIKPHVIIISSTTYTNYSQKQNL